METQAGEWERAEERKSRRDVASIEKMCPHVAFWVTVHSPGVSTCGNIRSGYGVQVTGDASYFSHLGSLCSSEPSGGLFFVAMDTVDGNSLGKSTPPQEKGVNAKTVEGFSGWPPGYILLPAPHCCCFFLHHLSCFKPRFLHAASSIWSGWPGDGLST